MRLLLKIFMRMAFYNDTRVGDIIHKLLLDIHYTIDIESKNFYEKEKKSSSRHHAKNFKISTGLKEIQDILA